MNKYKIIICVLFLSGFGGTSAFSQNVGLSFSFFFPKNGEFSTPISPFSFRGVGVNFNDYIGVETGFTLYRMAGLGMKELPFESDKSLIGPNFTLMVPVELVFTAPLQKFEFSVKGGGFAFYPFGSNVHAGNMDRALESYEVWTNVSSDYDGKTKAGFGFHFGSEIVLYIFDNFGISFEGNYFIGGADYALEGQYSGWNGTAIEEKTGEDAAFPDAQIDLSGLELSIGVILQTGNQNRRR